VDGGRTWWFCSGHCRDEFAANTQAFVDDDMRAAG
jgi:YHS domain-containing protein